MAERLVRDVIIVGGGTAGWMSAAAFAVHLGRHNCRFRLVESDQIGTVGVGEATIPVIREFNQRLGLDEVEFMRQTNATFKLGIQFENWLRMGESYIHPFGSYGNPINWIAFHHFWLKMHQQGDPTSFFDYSMPHVAAELGKFSLAHSTTGTLNLNYYYAFHFDSTSYAQYLRSFAEARGVQRTEGKVTEVSLDPESGDIVSITLESGEVIEGDLFIDCSGFRGLLIEQELQTGYEDWSHWLPCNRAWAVPTAYPEENVQIPPHTRSRALTAGWQWRIPLQNRIGNGHVFSADYIDEEQAREMVLEHAEGEPIAEPRLLYFTTGMRSLSWNRNCVAIGLSAGFLEPLESTSIYLIQAAIMSLINFFPRQGIDAADRDEFNQLLRHKYEEARDFVILHYKATERDDTEFWRYCRDMDIPAELERRMELFRHRGHVSFSEYDVFAEHSWLSVLIGQGIMPEHYDPRTDSADEASARQLLADIRNTIKTTAEGMPSHLEALADYCAGDLVTAGREG